MNTLLPIVLIALTFLALLLIRVVILLIMRSGETGRSRKQGPPPTVISMKRTDRD